MWGISKHTVVAYAALALATVVAYFSLHDGGTSDVQVFLDWGRHAFTHGIATGYETERYIDYPPLAYVVFYAVTAFSSDFGIAPNITLKWLLLVCLWVSTVFLLIQTRNSILVFVFQAVLILNATRLGYVDILPIAFLILAIWALQCKRLFRFAAFYTVACLLKWQSLVLGPFLAVYVLDVSWSATKGFDRRRLLFLKTLLPDLVLPASMILIPIALVFGSAPLDSLYLGLKNPVISGQAANFGWVLTYLLGVSSPGLLGPLPDDGRVAMVWCREWDCMLFMRLMKATFFLIYGLILIRFFRQPVRTLESLLAYTCLGFLTYIVLSSGVHENHLMLIIPLLAALASFDRRFLPDFLYWSVSGNLNMFMFYGWSGSEIAGSRPLIAGLDATVWLALLNGGMYLWFLVRTVKIFELRSSRIDVHAASGAPSPWVSGTTGGSSAIPGAPRSA
jgi:hypothetical protein